MEIVYSMHAQLTLPSTAQHFHLEHSKPNRHLFLSVAVILMFICKPSPTTNVNLMQSEKCHWKPRVHKESVESHRKLMVHRQPLKTDSAWRPTQNQRHMKNQWWYTDGTQTTTGNWWCMKTCSKPTAHTEQPLKTDHAWRPSQNQCCINNQWRATENWWCMKTHSKPVIHKEQVGSHRKLMADEDPLKSKVT